MYISKKPTLNIQWHLTHHYTGHDKIPREFKLSKMELSKKKTERSFWNIINNEVAFCYQFEEEYMDDADTLGTKAQWDNMSPLDWRWSSASKTSDALGWALRPNLATALPVTFGTSCEWDLLIISGPKLVVGRSNNWLKKSIIKIYYRLIFKTHICSFNKNGK